MHRTCAKKKVLQKEEVIQISILINMYLRTVYMEIIIIRPTTDKK